MLRAARLYETPKEFADMMLGRLEEELGVRLRQEAEDPLFLNVTANEGGQEEDLLRISLHHTFQTYMNTGDLNDAIDYLNNIIRTAEATRETPEAEMMKLDLSCVYPALREDLYVEAAGGDSLCDEALPGLSMVYLELHNGFSRIINRSLLAKNPGLTEERVKRVAHRNLRSEGWTSPKLSLPSPARRSCTLDVYLDNPVPIECQFLNPELVQAHMPDTFLIAFPNRQTTLVMHAAQAMETAEQAIRLARKSRFIDVVRRSFFVMRSPNSKNIYWWKDGKYSLVGTIDR